MLLGIILLFAAFFVAYVLVLRTNMLMDAHRYSRELKAQQELAEKAEASRLNELRKQLDHEFAHLREATDQSRVSLSTQVEGLEESLRNLIEETSRSQLAYIGEIEDKLDRNLATRSTSEQ